MPASRQIKLEQARVASKDRSTTDQSSKVQYASDESDDSDVEAFGKKPKPEEIKEEVKAPGCCKAEPKKETVKPKPKIVFVDESDDSCFSKDSDDDNN